MSFRFLQESPLSLLVVAGALIVGLLTFVYTTIARERPWPGFPIAALPEDGLSPKASWTKQGIKTVSKGLKVFDGPFQVITGNGPKIILPNRFAEELKNHVDTSFSGAIAQEFFHYSGFEAFPDTDQDFSFHAEVVRTKLTQSLGLVTKDLVDETTASVHDIFGEDTSWHDTLLKKDILHLVARLSSRVLLGPELCRNERWLEIAKDYTVSAFVATYILRLLPALIRPVVQLVLPPMVKLRRARRDAEKLIAPEVERRKDRVRKAREAGLKAPKTADMIGWMYELADEKKEEHNYAVSQLSLTMAAIHTTTGAMTQALLDIIAHPEYVQPLREEAIAIIKAEGWSKTTLYKLRLMDSFLKESQRLHPSNFVSMNRLAKKTIHLSDGTVLPAGARFQVANVYTDPEVYAHPERFDGARFLREREKSDQSSNMWQYVSLSSSHMAFGYGQHACPGRFFASNEIKIALYHLLLKYDWQPAGNGEDATWAFETTNLVKPNCKVQLRRRKEELTVDLPE